MLLWAGSCKLWQQIKCRLAQHIRIRITGTEAAVTGLDAVVFLLCCFFFSLIVTLSLLLFVHVSLQHNPHDGVSVRVALDAADPLRALRAAMLADLGYSKCVSVPASFSLSVTY